MSHFSVAREAIESARNKALKVKLVLHVADALGDVKALIDYMLGDDQDNIEVVVDEELDATTYQCGTNSEGIDLDAQRAARAENPAPMVITADLPGDPDAVAEEKVTFIEGSALDPAPFGAGNGYETALTE